MERGGRPAGRGRRDPQRSGGVAPEGAGGRSDSDRLPRSAVGSLRSERPRHSQRLSAGARRDRRIASPAGRSSSSSKTMKRFRRWGSPRRESWSSANNVHLMAGALLSSTGYALAPYIDSVGVPMLYPVVSADDLTQRKRSHWIVRTGWTRQSAEPRVRRIRVPRPQGAQGRHRRARLRVRLGVGRRLSADVRGGGRQRHAENLGARSRSTTSHPTSRRFAGTSTPSTRWSSAAPRSSSCASTRSSD